MVGMRRGLVTQVGHMRYVLRTYRAVNHQMASHVSVATFLPVAVPCRGVSDVVVTEIRDLGR